jgi:hypothetical protein
MHKNTHRSPVVTNPARKSCITSIFAFMKEYQAVILKLTQRTREDEDALTDLLNERSRGGWEPAMMSQDELRLTVVFSRRGEAAR